MASGGLQRRRAAPTGAEDDAGKSVEGKHAPDAFVEQRAGSGSVSALHAPSGRRIAYDPRDINNAREQTTQPRLTLMEEVYLLGLKDRQVRRCVRRR